MVDKSQPDLDSAETDQAAFQLRPEDLLLAPGVSRASFMTTPRLMRPWRVSPANMADPFRHRPAAPRFIMACAREPFWQFGQVEL